MTDDDYQYLDCTTWTEPACWIASEDVWHGSPISTATHDRLLAVTETYTGWLAVGHGSHDATIVPSQPRPYAPLAPTPATVGIDGERRLARRVARAVHQDRQTGDIFAGGYDVPLLWNPLEPRRPVLLTSPDQGRSWNDLHLTGVGAITAISAAPDGGPLAIGYDHGLAVWTPELDSWHRRAIYAPTLPDDVILEALVWTGTRFVAVGEHHPQHQCRPAVAVSEDGWLWHAASVGSAQFAGGVWGRMNAVAAAGDVLVAAGAINGYGRDYLDGAIWLSEDCGDHWELMHVDRRQPRNIEFHAVAIDRFGEIWAAGTVHDIEANRSEALVVTSREANDWGDSIVLGPSRPTQSKATVQALTSTPQGLVAVGMIEHLEPVELGADDVVWLPSENHR